MGSEWAEVSLKDVVSKLGDGLHGTPDYDSEGECFFINGNNLENGHIVLKEKTKRVSQNEFLKHKKDLNERTLLVSINGTLGNVAYYRGEKVVLGKSACYLNVVPEVNIDFIRYILQGNHFQNHIQQQATGTTIKNVSLKTMREYAFRLPPREYQDFISSNLKVLDQKIELNRQINTTLESMAQALFESWFVDFDPVIDNALAAGNPIPDALQARAEKRKALHHQIGRTDQAAPLQPLPAEIRALFPDSFVFNEEMGWVPKGWKVSLFGEVIKPSKGRNITKKDVGDGDIPVVAGGLSPAYYHNKPNVIGPVVTVSASGANAGFVSLYLEDIWASDCSYISSEHTKQVFSTYLFLKARQDEITFMQQGAAQPHVYPKDLMRLSLVVPPEELRMLLERYVKDYFLRIQVATKEITTLSKLRDTLLPKLLSGQITVAGCEALVSGVL